MRCTRQRELIYDALAATTAHPTAEELFQTVRHAEPGLSLATVYNTLDAFTDRGLCRRIPSTTGSGPARYDADTDHHTHIVLDDGSVVDVPADLAHLLSGELPPAFVEAMEAKHNIRISGVRVHLVGQRLA